MKQCFLVHQAVKVYLFIYRKVFAYLLRKTIISTMKNRVGQNEIGHFLNEFSYFCDTPDPP